MATPPGPQAPLTIAEDIPSGSLRVVLRDSDGPFGYPRQVTAFERGGEVAHQAIYLPGRRAPIYQVQQARQRDLQFHGQFRDHLRASDLGTADVTHARDMERQIEAIRRRANPLTVTWSDQSWSCLLKEALFAHEGDHDIQWTLTFAVASTADDPAEAPPATTATQAPVDAAALMATALATLIAAQAALVTAAAAPQPPPTLTNSLALTEAAASDLLDAVSALTVASATARTALATRVDSRAATLQTQAGASSSLFATTLLAAAVPTGTPAGIVAWQNVSYTTSAALGTIVDQA